MIGRRKRPVIDAVAEIERSERKRGAAEIGARRKLATHGSKMFLILAVVCVAAIGAGFTLKMVLPP